MISIDLVRSDDELVQIHHLNQQNLKQHLSQEEREKEGFVTWLYSLDLLQKMHALAPSIIARQGARIVAYALTTLREASRFHTDLQTMMHHLSEVQYRGKPLRTCNFYCMGQICVHKDFRGKGIAGQLYQKHKEVYHTQYELLVTEISTSNPRSQKAHERTGFRTIYTYADQMDEWNVVAWNWK